MSPNSEKCRELDSERRFLETKRSYSTENNLYTHEYSTAFLNLLRLIQFIAFKLKDGTFLLTEGSKNLTLTLSH